MSVSVKKKGCSQLTATRCILVAFFLLLLLSGCATPPVEKAGVSEPQKRQLWDQHQKQFKAVDRWQLEGRLGLRVSGDSGTMSIEWQQDVQRYHIYLDGPLGQLLARISGSPEGVILESSGQRHQGKTPEMLLYALTGWDLPVSSLKYWVMGLPVPGQPYTVGLNDRGVPDHVVQQGWTIRYLKYTSFDGHWLPAKMKVVRENMSATLAIRNRRITVTH